MITMSFFCQLKWWHDNQYYVILCHEYWHFNRPWYFLVRIWDLTYFVKQPSLCLMMQSLSDIDEKTFNSPQTPSEKKSFFAYIKPVCTSWKSKNGIWRQNFWAQLFIVAFTLICDIFSNFIPTQVKPIVVSSSRLSQQSFHPHGLASQHPNALMETQALGTTCVTPRDRVTKNLHGSPSTTEPQSLLSGWRSSTETIVVETERETLRFASQMSFRHPAARCFPVDHFLALFLDLPQMDKTSKYQVKKVFFLL